MKTLEEFKTAGGVLTGGKHGAHEEYDGPPRKYNEKLSTTFDKLGLEAKEALSGNHTSTSNTTHTGMGTGVGGTGTHTGTHTGNTGNTGMGMGNDISSRNHTGTNTGMGMGNDINTRNQTGTAGTTGTGIDSGLTEKSRHRGDSGIGGFGDDLQRKEVGSNKMGRDNINSTTNTKPTLRERLDPRIDADGDGKRGLGD